MSRLSVGDLAPDFALPDHRGNTVRLADVLEQHNVLLVFTIGYL